MASLQTTSLNPEPRYSEKIVKSLNCPEQPQRTPLRFPRSNTSLNTTTITDQKLTATIIVEIAAKDGNTYHKNMKLFCCDKMNVGTKVKYATIQKNRVAKVVPNTVSQFKALAFPGTIINLQYTINLMSVIKGISKALLKTVDEKAR